MSTARDLIALLAQVRRGAWTNEPTDPNYTMHHDGVPLAPDERIVDVFPGIARRGTGVGAVQQMVNVRVGSDNIYVDTPKVSAVGPLARLAQGALANRRLDEPQVIPRTALGHIPTAEEPRVDFSIGDLAISTRPGHVGRPSELSPREQLRNLINMARR